MCFRLSLFDFKGCFEENVDYKGNDISSLDLILSEEQCQFKCQEIDNCKYWRHYPPTQGCWLKTKKENIKEESGGSSGPKFCNGKKNCYLPQYNLNLTISILKDM